MVLLETEKQQLVEELSKVDRSHPEGEVADSYEMAFHHPPKEKGMNSRPPQPPPYSLSHHLRAVGLGLTNRTPLGPGQSCYFLCSKFNPSTPGDLTYVQQTQ